MDAVFFDMDDTIYKQTQPFETAFERVFGQNPELRDLDVEGLFKASRRHSDAMFAASERGEISMEDMYAKRIMLAFEDYGHTISRETALEFQGIYAHEEEYGISMSDTMRGVLDLVAGRSKAGLVTNGPLGHQLLKVRTLGLGEWMPDERILVSGGLDVAKPQPEMFLLACERAGSVPERCLYVGDSFAFDVAGPLSAGMPAVWFNHRGRERPDEPAPTWTVHSEQELYELLDSLL